MHIDTYVRQSKLLLERCHSVFRQYEEHHLAKGTPESDEKARKNAAMAERIEEFLSG